MCKKHIICNWIRKEIEMRDKERYKSATNRDDDNEKSVESDGDSPDD